MTPHPRKSKTDSVLAECVLAGIEQWADQKAAGATLAERRANLEHTLRAVWPQTRPWHYLCEACGDTGWQPRHCPSQHCGRPFSLPRGHRGGLKDYTGSSTIFCTSEAGHDYVKPCLCQKGRAMHQLLEGLSGVDGDDFTAAAKPARGMTRLGRR